MSVEKRRIAPIPFISLTWSAIVCAASFSLSPEKTRSAWQQAHPKLQEELRLDQLEGRSWVDLHKHALMTMIAYAFLQNRRLRRGSGGKRTSGPSPQPSPPAIRQAILDQIFGTRRNR